MDSNSTLFCLSGRQKLVHDMIWWCGPIQEVEIEMLDARLGELLLIILWLVKPDYERHSHLLKDWHVVLRCERAILISDIKRTRERYELTWDGPIQVTVFNFFIMLVLLHIERVVVIPAELDGQI